MNVNLKTHKPVKCILDSNYVILAVPNFIYPGLYFRLPSQFKLILKFCFNKNSRVDRG